MRGAAGDKGASSAWHYPSQCRSSQTQLRGRRSCRSCLFAHRSAAPSSCHQPRPGAHSCPCFPMHPACNPTGSTRLHQRGSGSTATTPWGQQLSQSLRRSMLNSRTILTLDSAPKSSNASLHVLERKILPAQRTPSVSREHTGDAEKSWRAETSPKSAPAPASFGL